MTQLMCCGQYPTYRAVEKLDPMRKKGGSVQIRSSQPSAGIPSVSPSPLYSQFTLGGMQGKLNKFRNLVLWAWNSLAAAMLTRAALESAI